MKYILFLIVFFCHPFFLPAQWFPVPVPTTQGLMVIAFTDTLHGYIPVEDGTILETSDGGINWQTKPTGTSHMLADICFPTPSTGYSVGDNGVIVKTTNAGATWSVISSPTGQVLRGVFFLSADTGFICGQGEHIFRTTNGGTTWAQQTSGAYWLRQFSFPTRQTGYCAGDGLLVYKTTNGGLTWAPLTAAGGVNLNDVQFMTADTGWVCGLTGYAAKTYNGGQTWQIQNTGTSIGFEGLWFFNSHAGYCVGSSGLILKTTNGGVSWTQETSGTTTMLRRAFFFNPAKGFICGGIGTLLQMGSCLPSPGAITGPSPVCQGDSGKIYSVLPVPNATGYHWTLPSGAVITSGNNTHSITVRFLMNAVSGNFSVYAIGACGNGLSSPTFPVIVNPLPVPTISGNNSVCVGTAAVIYTTQAGMSSYSWSVSSGGTITAGAGTNSITVTWMTAGSQTVHVSYTNSNGCSAASPASYNVTVNPLPVPTISGPVSVCQNSGGYIYTTEAGMTGYTWVVSAGGTITAGGTATSSTITITWNTTGAQTVSVNYTNAAGCTAASPVVYNVTVNSLPVPTLSGPGTPCVGSTGNVYSTEAGMSGYSWFVSPGGTIMSGGTSVSYTVEVYWNTTGIQSVSVNYTDANGCTAADSSIVWVDPLPLPVPTITGPASACVFSTDNNYTTDAGMTSYVWSVSPGGNITSGLVTNTITVTWDSAGAQYVSVLYTNQNGCTAQSPANYNVTVNPLPGPAGNITGPTRVCAGSKGLVYSVPPVSNASSYFWTLPLGFSIVSGNGTSSITVDVAADASTGTIVVYGTNFCGNGQPSLPFPVSVNIPPSGNAGPDGSTCQNLTFTVTQASALHYSSLLWYSNGPGILTDATTLSPTYTPALGETGQVTLTLVVTGIAPCGNDTSTMILDIKPKASVIAGSDLFTCGQTPVVLSGSFAANYQALLWTTSGSGSFDDPAVLHPVYTPGISDMNAGSIFLTLHATSAEPCDPDADTILITIQRPAWVNAGPDSSVCQDQQFTLNKALAKDYTAITWTTKGDGTFNDIHCTNPVYTPGSEDILHGTSELFFTADGFFPCGLATDSLILTINRKPSVHPGPDGSVCQGMTFPVEGVTASDFRYFTWEHKGKGVLSGTNTLSPVYTPAMDETGIVTLTLKVFGLLSCQSGMVSCQMDVKVYSMVMAEAGENQTIPSGSRDTLSGNASGGSGKFTIAWEPSDLLSDNTIQHPVTVTLTKDTTFFITVTDDVTGCSSKDSVRINVTSNQPPSETGCITIHNVITPNGDGVNDAWIIGCIENFPDNSVQIFNRWGDKVNSFDHYDNISQVWKGTNSKGELLPEGTYFYSLTIKNEPARSGWVFVRRGSN